MHLTQISLTHIQCSKESHCLTDTSGKQTVRTRRHVDGPVSALWRERFLHSLNYRPFIASTGWSWISFEARHCYSGGIDWRAPAQPILCQFMQRETLPSYEYTNGLNTSILYVPSSCEKSELGVYYTFVVLLFFSHISYICIKTSNRDIIFTFKLIQLLLKHCKNRLNWYVCGVKANLNEKKK